MILRTRDFRAVVFVLAATLPIVQALAAEPSVKIKAGILGLDTSHAVAFTEILNNPQAAGPLVEVEVIAAFPGGSRDVPQSWDTLPKYTQQIRDLGVQVFDSAGEVLDRSDVILLLSRDGRAHLELARETIRAGKPLFVDKPVAASLVDVVRVYDLAEKHDVPCFSSSALRYWPAITGLKDDPKVGQVVGCDAYSPNKQLEPSHGDFYYFGIHGVETLLTIMGPGCTSVTRTTGDGVDLAVGAWGDGRIGSFRAIRKGRPDFGAVVFGSRGIATIGHFDSYEPLVVEIARFFATGKAPVSREHTLEIYAFMEAADESKRRGGVPVSVQEVLEAALREAVLAEH